MTNPIESQVPHDLNAGGEVGKERSEMSRPELYAMIDSLQGTIATVADRIRDGSLLSRRSSNEAGVRVKKLEWQKRHESEFLSRAETILGLYRLWSHHEANGEWFWSLSDGAQAAMDSPSDGSNDTEADAKAAAQADYEQRILSTLSPSPSIRAEPVAWRYRDAWGNWAYCQAIDNVTGPTVITEKQPLFASPQSPYPGGEAVAEIDDVIWRVSDEELRHIAESKDTGSCRVRIKQALVKAFGQTSPATEHQEVSEATPRMIDAAWQYACELDDRTSPEDYPNHALLTRDELGFAIEAALSVGRQP